MSEALHFRFETPTRARVMEALEAAKEKRDAFRREARAVLRATTGAVGEDNQMRRNLRRAVDAEAREWRDAMQKPSALKQMLETREPCFFTPAARAAPAAAPAAAAAAVTHPFKVTYAGASSTVTNGQIGWITPTLDGGDTLDDVPAPTIDLSGAAASTRYVYAVLGVTLTDTGGWVHSAVLDTVDIQAFSTTQSDDLTGTYYKLLATVTNGVVISQPVQTSLTVTFTDDGTHSGQATASYSQT